MAHLRTGREAIRSAWAAELAHRGFARLLTPEEAEAESARVYDALIERLETGRYHSAQAYAQDMAERDVFRGIGAKQVIGRLLVLRDVCGRALRERCGGDPAMEAGVRDVYEPVINRILTIVAMAFLQERERAVGRGREQLGALVEAGKVLGTTTADVARFLKEARLVAKLMHPNLAEIYTVLEERGELLLVFEFVDGRTLDKVIGTNHSLPTRRSARYTGGLWVGKYLKTVTYQEITNQASSAAQGELCGRVSRVERFEGHARSGDVRVAKYAGAELDWAPPEPAEIH